jgi:hypothetical protein
MDRGQSSGTRINLHDEKLILENATHGVQRERCGPHIRGIRKDIRLIAHCPVATEVRIKAPRAGVAVTHGHAEGIAVLLQVRLFPYPLETPVRTITTTEGMTMDSNAWVQEFPAAITVCDDRGTILEMNNRALASFADEGGAALLGTNILECHPEPARTTLRAMLGSARKNIYTIRTSGVKKVIYQSPWYRDGIYAGFVELSLPIPEDMPHFDRDAPKP